MLTGNVRERLEDDGEGEADQSIAIGAFVLVEHLVSECKVDVNKSGVECPWCHA